MKKNKIFIFILGISLLVLIALVAGSFIFAKDSSLVFSGDGYIITGDSSRHYFKSGTTYKENLNDEFAFKNDKDENVSVNKDSFIHYSDKSLGFMQNGAVMDLNSANMSIVPYYNITNKSTLGYGNGKYIINTATNTLEFQDILGRISENKYIVAGKSLKLKLSDKDVITVDEYLEITIIENGIVKIENQEASYQTTTQGTYIYVGDKVVIDFNSMKIVYDGETEMSLSQITINGDENIDILTDEEAVKPNEGVNGGDNDGNGAIGDNVENEPDGEGTGDEEGTGTEDESQEEDSIIKTDAYIELVDASVSANGIKASFKYNNTSEIEGNLILNIVDISTGGKVYSKVLDKTKSTDDVIIESLVPDTNYLMTISNSNKQVSTQYFGQSFRTEQLGITLNKVYATSNSLTYIINYNENTKITSVTLALLDENMEKVGTSLISNYNSNEEITFSNLNSNTSYVLKVESLVMDSLNYPNIYDISRTDITLKKTPDASTMELESESKGSSAKLSVSKVTDEDTAIKSYTYKIYASNYSSEEENEVLFSKMVEVGKDSTFSSMKLDIMDLKEEDRDLGYYRFSVDITYYDNEKTMTLYNQQISSAFYLGKEEVGDEEEDSVKLKFEQDFDSTTYSSIVGKITITDKNHKILVHGRDNHEGQTKFTLKYYSGDVSKISSTSFNVSSEDIDENGKIVKDITLTGLTNNSGYIIEVYADMYDNEGNVVNQLVDRSFSGTTKSDVDKLKFNFSKDNGSDDVNVINFDGMITSTNPESTDTLKQVTVKLYKGSSAELGNLLMVKDPETGLEKEASIILTGNDIYDKNYTFTNNAFGIADVVSLIEASGGTLYQNYTIQFTEAQYESGNMAEVENSIYTYSISLAYMLEQQLDEPTIAISPIKNGTTDSTLDASTLIGYEVTVSAAIEKLKELLGTTGVENINYYIYKLDEDEEGKITDKDGNTYTETLVKSFQSNELNMEFYFKDITEYNRGGRYVFKYDISLAGMNEKYPTKPVTSDIYTPEKQSPLFSLYKSSSTENSVTYKYRFTDIDDAIHKEVKEDGTYEYKFYYSLNDSKDYLTKELVVSNEYHELVIDNLNSGDKYSLSYYKETTIGDPILATIETNVFEGVQDIANYGVTYELLYSSNDNRLSVKINDNEFLDRIKLYEVVIKASGVTDYKKIFTTDDLTTCPRYSEDSEVSNNCLIIDYASIEKFIAKDTNVSVNVYYDDGEVGIDNTSEYGVVFESRDGTYLNLFNEGEFKTDSYTYSLYNFKYEEIDEEDGNKKTVMTIDDYFNKDVSGEVKLTYLSNGISYGDKGIFEVKVIDYGSISSIDDYFRFDSIIPKVTPNIVNRTINSFKLNLGFSGLTLNSLKNQFEKEDGSYYVYVDLYDDSECTSIVKFNEDIGASGRIEIVEDSKQSIGYKINDAEFTELIPSDEGTNYYYKLYAKLKQNDGTYKRIELFDANDNNGYSNSIYQVSTRGISVLFANLAAYYDDSVNYGPSYDGRYFWIYYYYINGTFVNYDLRLQLLDEDGNDYLKSINLCENVSLKKCTTLPGEQKVILSNFSDSKVSPISSYNNKNSGYARAMFKLDDNFVFGNGYYRLVMTAVSTTQTGVDENGNPVYAELVLKDIILNEAKGDNSGKGKINVRELYEPDFTEKGISYQASKNNSGKGIFEVTILPVDKDKVMINPAGDLGASRGRYNVSLLDPSENIIAKCSDLDASASKKITFDGNQCSLNGSAYDIALDSYYYIQVETTTFRNNISLFGNKGKAEVTDFIARRLAHSASAGEVSIGNNVTAVESGNSIIVTFSGASGFNKISKVDYSVNVSGGAMIPGGSGTKHKTDTKPIFSVKETGTYVLELSGFTLNSNVSYSLSLSFYDSSNNILDRRAFDVLKLQ